MTTTEEVHRPHPSLGLLALLALLALLVVLVAGASSWAGAKVATVSGEVVEAEQVTFEAGGPALPISNKLPSPAPEDVRMLTAC